MEPTKRIIVNTLAQHIRSIINIGLSLYSTRLVLQALGESDYGVFSLVAGVVAMLGFLTNAMVVTTQRQLSFLHGKGDINHVRRMFSNSLLLHILFGLLLVAILCAIRPLLFNGFLNIAPDRTAIAANVYYLVILSLFVTFLAAPYRALFIARENIVYISIIDVLDGFFKLFFALWLLTYGADRLIAYAWTTVAIMAFNYLAFALWARSHFEESVMLPKRSDICRQDMKELTGFAGWTIYSMGCIIGRTQGVNIILNRFFGTVTNAAYGLAQHVFGAVMFVSQAIVNAISPQLIKAEGRGDRQHMLRFAEALSKYSFLLLSMIVIPLVFEMPAVLSLWLDKVPENTVLLCRFILITGDSCLGILSDDVRIIHIECSLFTGDPGKGDGIWKFRCGLVQDGLSVIGHDDKGHGSSLLIVGILAASGRLDPRGITVACSPADLHVDLGPFLNIISPGDGLADHGVRRVSAAGICDNCLPRNEPGLQERCSGFLFRKAQDVRDLDQTGKIRADTHI